MYISIFQFCSCAIVNPQVFRGCSLVSANILHRRPRGNDDAISDFQSLGLALLRKRGWVAVIFLNDDFLSGNWRFDPFLTERG